MSVDLRGGGLIVVKDHDVPWRESARHGCCKPDYLGFDGLVWPGPEDPDFVDPKTGLAAVSRLDEVAHYCFTQVIDPKRLLFVREHSAAAPAPFSGFSWVGIDVGYFSADCCYSFVFEDIIWRRLEELIYFERYLNGNGLFETDDPIAEFLKSRDRCVTSGMDMEVVPDVKVTPIDVWLFNALSRE
jgi:hypothetical protein